MFYIQRQDNQTKQLETVDEFTTRKEANDMRYEYVMSDRFANYHISTRPCKDWVVSNLLREQITYLKEEKDLKKNGEKK